MCVADVFMWFPVWFFHAAVLSSRVTMPLKKTFYSSAKSLFMQKFGDSSMTN